MNKIFNTLLKPARWILLIGSFVYLVIFAVATSGGLGGRFLPVVSTLIILLAGMAALAAVPVCLLLKKEDAAKLVFTILAGYWVISTILGQLGQAQMIDNGTEGLVITACVFSFLMGLCILGVLVLLVLNYVLKKDIFRLAAVLTMVGVILFALVAGILWMVVYGKWGLGWTLFVDAVGDYFILPTLILFGYLYFYGAPQLPEKAPKAKAEPKEEKKEEPKEQEEVAE